MKSVLIISCEHASNLIPAKYAKWFSQNSKLLATHQSWDIGALALYQQLCKTKWVAFHSAGKWSRLLVDLNRSLTHPKLLSAISVTLSTQEKLDIIENYYQPYRTELSNYIQTQYAQANSVLHLSLHSFTPELNGQERNCDLGLLYDPKRDTEKNFTRRFKTVMGKMNPLLVTRMNYPYLGTADGFTSFMRKRIPTPFYAGIEIEMNQKHFDAQGQCETTLINDIVNTLNYLFEEDSNATTFLR